MSIATQVCMVVVTIALTCVAVLTIRVLLQLRVLMESASRSLAELPALISEAKRMSVRADELLLAFSQITKSARAGMSQIEGIATRSTTLASGLLDEVERPLAGAIDILRGLRWGVSFLFQRLKSGKRSPSHTNQGDNNVGEQRWLDDGGVSAGSGGGRGTGPDVRANGR